MLINYLVFFYTEAYDCGQVSKHVGSLQRPGLCDAQVPRVFIKGECIGGGSETKSLYNSGKLKSMLV